MGGQMERKLQMGYLLDFYGGFLTSRQALFLDLYYNQDFSLGEIAEQEGISRQGVHDALKRGEAGLQEMEERLGLIQKYRNMQSSLAGLHRELLDWKPNGFQDQKRRNEWLARTAQLLDAWDDED